MAWPPAVQEAQRKTVKEKERVCPESVKRETHEVHVELEEPQAREEACQLVEQDGVRAITAAPLLAVVRVPLRDAQADELVAEQPRDARELLRPEVEVARVVVRQGGGHDEAVVQEPRAARHRAQRGELEVREAVRVRLNVRDGAVAEVEVLEQRVGVEERQPRGEDVDGEVRGEAAEEGEAQAGERAEDLQVGTGDAAFLQGIGKREGEMFQIV